MTPDDSTNTDNDPTDEDKDTFWNLSNLETGEHWYRRFGVKPTELERISLNVDALIGLLNVVDARLENGMVDAARLQIKGLPYEDLEE